MTALLYDGQLFVPSDEEEGEGEEGEDYAEARGGSAGRVHSPPRHARARPAAPLAKTLSSVLSSFLPPHNRRLTSKTRRGPPAARRGERRGRRGWGDAGLVGRDEAGALPPPARAAARGDDPPRSSG